MSLSVVELTRVCEYQFALAELEVALDRAASPPIPCPPGFVGEQLGTDAAQDLVARCRAAVEDAEEKLRALGLDPELAVLIRFTSDEIAALGGDR